MGSPNDKGINLGKHSDHSDNKTVGSCVPVAQISSETIKEPDRPHFEFVESIANPAARSHAMKAYWRQRKNERRRQEDLKTTRPNLRPLLSSKPREDHHPESSTQSQPTNETSPCQKHSSLSIGSTQTLGIPDQLLAGINFAFAFVLGQRTETGSYQILAHHQRFFYHWLSMHAHVLHSGLEARTFTPFRDVWMPLDLSNAASFNGILAHAAADLFGLRGEGTRSEPLEYKTEAIEIINKWLGSTVTATKDEVFAGVVRLLTFERCWGTRARYNMHKHGLRQMVQARGGYEAFGSNWRLQLVLSLLSMVEVPGQSESLAYLREEFENLVYEILGLPYLPHQASKYPKSLNQLQHLTSLAEAIKLLQHRRETEEVTSGDNLRDREAASKCLQSLLFIWATFQESEELCTGSPLKEENNALHALNTFLHGSRHIWATSENEIFSLVWENLAKRKENVQITLFVTMVTESLQGISSRALRGAEQCLLSYWN